MMAEEGEKQTVAARPIGELAPAEQTLTIRQLLDLGGSTLDLRVVAGQKGLDNVIKTSEWNRPGVAFAGFLEVFAHDRIQILGNTELSYLHSLSPRTCRNHIKRIFRYAIPCFIVTSRYDIPPEITQLAEARNIPVLKSGLPTARFVAYLAHVLEPVFAPSMTVHGVLLDVYGLGVLLLGESGAGKSECALELVHRGHRLVADDVVLLRRRSKSVVVGSSSPLTKHHMEVRGLGIIDVEALFGAGAVCDEKTVDLVIWLEPRQAGKEYDRLGIEDQKRTVFDVEIPEYVIPVEPGRNLSILVEVAAMNQRLKSTGFNPARSLNERLIKHMQTKDESRRMNDEV